MRQNLTPGRYCDVGSQCYSGVCTSNKCIGTGIGKRCAHTRECDPGMSCQIEDWTTFPHITTCQPYQDTGDNCRDDNDCKMTDFCWYANPDLTVAANWNEKKCM